MTRFVAPTWMIATLVAANGGCGSSSSSKNADASDDSLATIGEDVPPIQCYDQPYGLCCIWHECWQGTMNSIGFICKPGCDPATGFICGNAQVDPGEACDDGNTINGDGCTSLCQAESLPGLCGDGHVDYAEVCDDGNASRGDGCSADCASIEPGWRCPIPGKACEPICGDGYLIGREECDDGNTLSGDGCSQTCRREIVGVASICGDGVIAPDEECDDGTENGELGYGGCTLSCTRGPFCGDGMVNGPEQCDLGVLNGAHGYGDVFACTSACQLAPFCGDGIVDSAFGEQCDFGADNGTSRSLCGVTCSDILY